MARRARRRDWDGTTKGWVNECPQAFVQWLREQATFKRSLPTELKKITDFEVDGLMEIEEDGQDALMEIEFQSKEHEYMGDRLLLYNDLASAQHGYQAIWSYVIYLKEVKQLPESPFIKRMPDGTEIKRLYFTLIKMWEISASDLQALGLDELLPLIPLTKGGDEPQVIESVVEALKAKKRHNLIMIAKEYT